MTDGLRLLVCVDGSRTALHAARLAIRLAAEHGGVVRVLSVVDDGDLARQLDARGLPGSPAGQRFARDVRAMLDRVAALAADREVDVVTAVLEGDPLRAVLRDADDWRPDLVLVGRTGRSGPGSPLVGSLAMHLVEFSDWPVTIVPPP